MAEKVHRGLTIILNQYCKMKDFYQRKEAVIPPPILDRMEARERDIVAKAVMEYKNMEGEQREVKYDEDCVPIRNEIMN